MRILIAAAVAAVLFGGCGTAPIRSSDAQQAPKERLLAFQERTEKTTAKIIVTRDTGFMGSACYLGVRINGIVAARLWRGETSSFYVEPGEILLSVGTDPLGHGICNVDSKELITRESYVRPGEEKFYRVLITAGHALDITRSEVE